MVYATQITMAFFASLSYALLYNIKGMKVWYAAIGGLMAWSTYLVLGLWLDSNVLQYFIAASLVTVYAEVLARITKTPTTTYLIVSIISLVPGSGLYYTMSYACKGLWEKSVNTGLHTLALSAALASGIMFASSIWRLTTALHKRWTKYIDSNLQ